jgi:hypothetical protein
VVQTVDVTREAGEVIVLVAFEEPVLSAYVDVAGTEVLVAFEEPVLIATLEYEGVEVAVAMLEDVLPWRKIPPGVLLAVAYVPMPVYVEYPDNVVEITDCGALVGNAGREDP